MNELYINLRFNRNGL